VHCCMDGMAPLSIILTRARRLHPSPLFLHVSARPVCLDQRALGCHALLALLETGHALSLQYHRTKVDLYLAAAKDWEESKAYKEQSGLRRGRECCLSFYSGLI
jgi:hypothetical protein